MEDKCLQVPAVALRGITILPGMVVHFDISRSRSIGAVESAIRENQPIFLVTQKNVDKEEPLGDDLYQVGVLAEIKQVMKLQNDIVRVLVEGTCRAEIYEISQEDPFLQVRVIAYDKEEDIPQQVESAMGLSIRETFAKYAAVWGKIGPDVLRQVEEITDLGKLIDFVANNLPVHYTKKQKILDRKSVV